MASGISGSQGSLDLIYSALGVITEETQGDPSTMAVGTGAGKLYNSTGGMCGTAPGGSGGLVPTDLSLLPVPTGSTQSAPQPTQWVQAGTKWEKLN